MSRRRFHRPLSMLAAVALLALSVTGGTTLAGNTRLVYIGDPGGVIQFNPDGTRAFGSLTYTPTRPGGLTAVDIQVRNDGGQTLNHAFLRGGTAADTSPVNPLFPPPSGASLPADLSYAAAFPSVGTCTLSATSLSCALGQLPAGASVTVRVVVQTSAATVESATWFGVFLAEGNASGTNQDNFYATGTVTTFTPVCQATKNRDANYFLPNDPVGLATADCTTVQGGQSQNAAIRSGNAVGGQGTFGSLAIGDVAFSDLPLALQCPDGFTCHGYPVETRVLDGQPVPGGLQWTVRWFGIRSLTGVIHFRDNYVRSDPSTFAVIPFKNQFKCGRTAVTNCWVSTSFSKGNETPSWFEAVFITPVNGRGGGYF